MVETANRIKSLFKSILKLYIKEHNIFDCTVAKLFRQLNIDVLTVQSFRLTAEWTGAAAFSSAFAYTAQHFIDLLPDFCGMLHKIIKKKSED